MILPVLELRSPNDNLAELQDKMREYLGNGVRLGWLLDRQRRCAEIYRSDCAVEIKEAPVTLSGEDVLPGFELKFSST